MTKAGSTDGRGLRAFEGSVDERVAMATHRQGRAILERSGPLFLAVGAHIPSPLHPNGATGGRLKFARSRAPGRRGSLPRGSSRRRARARQCPVLLVRSEIGACYSSAYVVVACAATRPPSSSNRTSP